MPAPCERINTEIQNSKKPLGRTEGLSNHLLCLDRARLAEKSAADTDQLAPPSQDETLELEDLLPEHRRHLWITTQQLTQRHDPVGVSPLEMNELAARPEGITQNQDQANQNEEIMTRNDNQQKTGGQKNETEGHHEPAEHLLRKALCGTLH